MTKSTQRARDASKPKSAMRQRTDKTRISDPLKAGKAVTGIPATDTYQPTDVTPDEFFKAWPRKDREALIDVLIDTLDVEAGDADLEETGDAEPSLGFLDCFTGSGRSGQAGGCVDDREVEDEHDEDPHDREPDEADYEPSAGFDDPELDHADDEPSLGWTVDGALADGDGMDREAGGSSVTEAQRQRYKPFDRYSAIGNCDGKHVDAERGYGYASRRLRNLSDKQRAAVSPRLNRDEVRI